MRALRRTTWAEPNLFLCEPLTVIFTLTPPHNLHITVIATNTCEILRDLTLDPTRDYQPRGVKP